MKKNNFVIFLSILSLLLIVLYFYLKNAIQDEINDEIQMKPLNAKIKNCQSDKIMSKEDLESCNNQIKQELVNKKMIIDEKIDLNDIILIQSFNNKVSNIPFEIKNNKIVIKLNNQSLNSCISKKLISYYINGSESIEIDPYSKGFIIGCNLDSDSKNIMFIYEKSINFKDLQDFSSEITKILKK